MRTLYIFVSLLLVLFPVCGRKSDLRGVGFTQYITLKSWKEAQSFCREKHTDLATIRSEEENLVFNSWSWIGLYRNNDRSPWKWSRGDKPATFFRWSDNTQFHQHYHCADKYGEEWFTYNCEAQQPFICFDENLVLVKENKSWEEALDHCRSLGGHDSENLVSVLPMHSYDLATLVTEDDHDYARERAQQASTDEVWTGLRFLGDGWFWAGGEAVQYQDIPSCPAFSCGVLERNGSTSFGLRACSQRRNFLCYRRPEKH